MLIIYSPSHRRCRGCIHSIVIKAMGHARIQCRLHAMKSVCRCVTVNVINPMAVKLVISCDNRIFMITRSAKII